MQDILIHAVIVQTCSTAGCAIILVGALIAGIAYRGRQGERYSPFNHFISELGEQGISRLAWVFNTSLVMCGLCLLPACTSLGLLLPGWLAKIGMAAGIITALSIAMVGVFPMNKLQGHVIAASSYFHAGLLTVVLFTLAIGLQGEPAVLPRSYFLAGIPAIFAYGVFLVLMRVKFTEAESALTMLEEVRPKTWWMAVAEWAVFLTSIPFFLVIGMDL